MALDVIDQLQPNPFCAAHSEVLCRERTDRRAEDLPRALVFGSGAHLSALLCVSDWKSAIAVFNWPCDAPGRAREVPAKIARDDRVGPPVKKAN